MQDRTRLVHEVLLALLQGFEVADGIGVGWYRGEVQELGAVQRHHPRRIARLALTVPSPLQTDSP